MSRDDSRRVDVARQWASCAAAVAQVALPALLPPRFDTRDQPPNVIQPSPATFSVWLPIFATSLGYAAYQARPSLRDQALLRTVGWPLSAAFACTGVWAPLLRKQQYWAAQVALLGIAGGAETARRRLATFEATSGLGRGQKLAVVPVTAMLAAWGAAAAGVNLAAMLSAYRLVPPGRPTTTAGNVLVLALGAVGALGSGRRAPATSRAYVSTLLWALGGIVAGQRRRSPSAATCAALSAAAVLWSASRPATRL